jgi:protein-tyrosine-phosphatase
MKLPSKKLKHAAIQHSVEYIKRKFGIDIGEKERQQLVPEMMNTADLAIVIAERESWPGYLKEDDKVVFWDIPDPARMADGAADEVYKEVQRRVEQLVAKIG